MPYDSEQNTGRALEAWNWLLRIGGLNRVLGLILFIALFQSSVQASQSVALTWNPSSDTNVVGYDVYYGVASGTYSNMIDVGDVTSATISGLIEGTTYYFAATAYDSLGNHSDYSDEASYTVPASISNVQLRNGSAGQFILTLTGPVGLTYDIQATQDFKTWTIIGTATVGAGGSLDFTDTNAASFPSRFYRAHQNP